MEQGACTICEKKLFSDATIKEFCKLCGMAITREDATMVKKATETVYFCCNDCFEKYELLKREKNLQLNNELTQLNL